MARAARLAGALVGGINNLGGGHRGWPTMEKRRGAEGAKRVIIAACSNPASVEGPAVDTRAQATVANALKYIPAAILFFGVIFFFLAMRVQISAMGEFGGNPYYEAMDFWWIAPLLLSRFLDVAHTRRRRDVIVYLIACGMIAAALPLMNPERFSLSATLVGSIFFVPEMLLAGAVVEAVAAGVARILRVFKHGSPRNHAKRIAARAIVSACIIAGTVLLPWCALHFSEARRAVRGRRQALNDWQDRGPISFYAKFWPPMASRSDGLLIHWDVEPRTGAWMRPLWPHGEPEYPVTWFRQTAYNRELVRLVKLHGPPPWGEEKYVRSASALRAILRQGVMKRVPQFPFRLTRNLVLSTFNRIEGSGDGLTEDALHNHAHESVYYWCSKRYHNEVFVRVAKRFLSVWSPDGSEICTVRRLGKRRAPR